MIILHMYCKHGKWMYFDLDKERKNNKKETKKTKKMKYYSA